MSTSSSTQTEHHKEGKIEHCKWIRIAIEIYTQKRELNPKKWAQIAYPKFFKLVQLKMVGAEQILIRLEHALAINSS